MAAHGREKNKSNAARVGSAAGNGLGKMVTALPKATLVDMPMAITDGLNGVPALYGQKVSRLEHIDGAKTGSIAAGKVSRSILKSLHGRIRNKLTTTEFRERLRLRSQRVRYLAIPRRSEQRMGRFRERSCHGHCRHGR